MDERELIARTNDAELMPPDRIRPLLADAGELVAIIASSKKSAARNQSQTANRKPQIL